MKKFLKEMGLAAGLLAGAMGGKAEAKEAPEHRKSIPGVEQVHVEQVSDPDKQIALEDQKAISAALADAVPPSEVHKERFYQILVPLSEDAFGRVNAEFGFTFNSDEIEQIQRSAEDSMTKFVKNALDNKLKKRFDTLDAEQKARQAKMTRDEIIKSLDGDPGQNMFVEVSVQLFIRSLNAEKNKQELAKTMEDAMRIKAQEIMAKRQAK